jgi:hypothetical protein
MGRKPIDLSKVNQRLDEFLKRNKGPTLSAIGSLDDIEDDSEVEQDVEKTTTHGPVEITDTFNPIPGFILLPRDPIYGSVKFHRKFARYLCDLVLVPHETVVSYDHVLYWNNTRKMVKVYDEVEIEMENSNKSNLLQDFRTTVEFAALPWRLEHIDQEFINEIKEEGLIQDKMSYLNVLNQLGPAALSLLDGFVSDPSKFDNNGNLKSGYTERPWRDDSSSSGHWNYHDRILYWKQYESDETTRESLEKINDLGRYNVEALKNKAGIGDVDNNIDDEDSGTENYFRVLTGQRNLAVHGHGSGFSIAPVAITLCCLYIWDNINPKSHSKFLDDMDESYPDWSEDMWYK